MTSTNSCSENRFKIFDPKLFLGTIKRSAWLIMIISIVLFFASPVYTLMQYQSIDDDIVPTLEAGINSGNAEEIAKTQNENAYFLQRITSPLSVRNSLATIITIGAGIICGLAAWSYLFSKSKSDFYHSLPHKRESLFSTFGLSHMLLYIVPYLISKAMQLAIVFFAFPKFAQFLDAGEILYAIVFNLLLFFIIFSFTTLACMLTGNLPVAVCAIAVLTLGFGVVLAFMFIFQEFFPTMIIEMSPLVAILQKTSFLVDAFTDGMFGMALLNFNTLIYWSIFALALFILSFFLYRIRPSESAGKSLAFKKSRNFIKYPMIFSATILCGTAFANVTSKNRTEWMIFGFIVGALLSNLLLEIIIDIDVKSFKKGFKGLLVFGGAFTAMMLCFAFDIAGYNTYVPKTEKVGSVSVAIENMELPALYDKDSRITRTEELLDYYTFTDEEIIKSVMDMASVNKKDKRSNDLPNRAYFTVKYNLKNGFTPARRYNDVPLTPEVIAAYDKIFDSKIFKEKNSGVLIDEENKSRITGAVIYDVNTNKAEERQLISNKDVLEELISAYQKDYENLTAQDVKTKKIQFNIEVESERQSLSTIKEESLTGRYYTRSNCNLNIYPQFKNVKAVLDKANIKYPAEFNLDEVEGIYLYLQEHLDQETNDINYNADNVYVTKDAKEIEKILKTAISDNNTAFLLSSDREFVQNIHVVYKDKSEITFFYQCGQVPDFVKDLKPNANSYDP